MMLLIQRKFLTLALVHLIAGAPGMAAAQSQTTTQTGGAAVPRFEAEIVVTPERGETPVSLVPAATIVLERPALQLMPAVHLTEVLSFLPGFSVTGAGVHAGRPVVSVRGFFGGGEADYTLLLVDGVPVSDVESGLVDWTVVPTPSIRRVEATRGPGSALYGDSAMGGVIQVFTDQGPGGGQVSASAGSFGTFTADALYGRRGRAAGFTAAAAVRRTDGAFDHSGGHQLVASGNADGQAGGLLWRWTAAADGRSRDDSGPITRPMLASSVTASDPIYRLDTLDRQGFSNSFMLRHASLAGRPQVRVHLGARDEDRIRTILLAPGLGDTRSRSLSTTAVGVSAEGEQVVAATRPLRVRFGVDLSRERLDTDYRSLPALGAPGTIDSAASGHRVRAGLFTSAAWDPHARLRLTGAVRWDDVDDGAFGQGAAASRQRAWSPRAGVVVQLDETHGIVAFSQVSRAFKAPTVDQRFDPRPYPDFRGGTFTISNAALVPQRAVNVEAGVSGAGRIRWSAVAYRMSLEDEIDFDLRTFRYANIGQSRHVGVELEAEGRWSARVRPSVSYVLSRVGDTVSDLQLKNIPQHRVSVGVGADLPGAVGLLARYSRSSGGYLDDENAYELDGPSTIDLRVRRAIGRHLLFVDVLNLGDDVFEEQGFTLTDFVGRAVPYVFPGAPRAVRVGFTAAF
jgi:outer membrane cobalamin receptor